MTLAQVAVLAGGGSTRMVGLPPASNFNRSPRVIVCRFVHGPDDDRYAYWRALARVWVEPDVLVNIEHDMEHSPALVDELIACPHPLCSHAYRMHIPRTYWAHGNLPDHDWQRREGSGIRWIGEGDEWAEYSAIGFCKIALEARVGRLARCEWPAVELNLNHAVRGSWHIHWPGVEHYHKEPR